MPFALPRSKFSTSFSIIIAFFCNLSKLFGTKVFFSNKKREDICPHPIIKTSLPRGNRKAVIARKRKQKLGST